MKILVTGGTGFVGTPLVRFLTANNHEVVLLSRNADKAKATVGVPVTAFSWDPATSTPPKEAFQGVDAIVHLAGESIAAGRWTDKQKKKI